MAAITAYGWKPHAVVSPGAQLSSHHADSAALPNSQPGPLAPGEYAAIYGETLAGLTDTAQEVPYVPVLADVAVTVNGQPAPM